MSLWRMIIAEVSFRRLSFTLGCISVAVAVGAVVGSIAMLRGHDWRTEKLVEQKEIETREAMARMEDDYRVIMKRMGYNVMVLPAEQDPDELRMKGYVTATMPYEYAEKLAAAGVMSLNHLLPVLQREFQWEETGEKVLLCGVRGQMSLPGRRGGRSPIQAPIPPGRVALGNALAKRINVASGETITLQGTTFTVERVDPARGTIEDMALWVALDLAQKWLQAPDLISGILALECVCHSDSFGAVVEEVQSILPGTKVFEFSSMVRGRAEARMRAAETRREAVLAEQEQRQRLRVERHRAATTISALAIAGAVLWVFVLSFGNARDRISEIGLLRAVGVHQQSILLLLLGKALIMGALGGVAGVVAGWAIGVEAAGVAPTSLTAWQVAGGWHILVVWILGPVLAGAASLIPALMAAHRDPAEVLGRE